MFPADAMALAVSFESHGLVLRLHSFLMDLPKGKSTESMVSDPYLTTCSKFLFFFLFLVAPTCMLQI